MVADTLAEVGLLLDDWQETVLQAALGVRTDGRWSTPQVALSAPRQNGKSELIVARALAGILVFDERLIIVSAHQQDTAREVFSRLLDILERDPRLDDRVESYGRALNREYIRFKSGQVIRFKARSSGGGRGFSCDCLLLDEAQILSAAAWAAILPTLSARPNPQVWLLGTPPTPADDGVVFSRMRAAGIAGKQSKLAYLEWSADSSDDADDVETWRKANPALGSRISMEAVEGERTAMDDAQFARERLGIWDQADAREAVIPTPLWETLEAEGPSDGTAPAAMAVDASHDGALVAAGCWRADDASHVELLAAGEWADDNVAADWISERAGRRIPVVIDSASPAARLIPLLQARGVNVVSGTSHGMAKACGGLYAAVVAGLLTWGGPNGYLIGRALAGAQKRKIGDAGGWGWDRRNPQTNISPLVAVTLAHYGASNAKKRTGSGRSNGDRRAVSV